MISELIDARSARILKVLVVWLLLLSLKIDVLPVSFESIASGYYSLKENRLESTLEFLASKNFRGRKTGTPEEELTTAYMASVFRRNGLQPPATTGGTYIQTFELTQALPKATSRVTLTEPGHPPVQLKIGEEFLPASFGIETDEVSARLVFVGYGITAPELKYDNYARLDVKGKIVVALSKSPGENARTPWDFFAQKDYDDPLEKVLRAQSAGAAGFVMILPSNETIPALETINYRTARTYLSSQVNRIKIPAVFVNAPTGTRLLASGSKVSSLDEIQEQIENNPHPPPVAIPGQLSMELHYDRKALTGRNVLGVIPGSDPNLKEECLILGAHHDHLGASENNEIYYGADDDASGITGLLELSYAFQSGNLMPKRSILLAGWGAEEIGLLGSRYYAQNPAFPLSQTVAMLQLDMIGRNEERPADPANHIQEEKPLENGNTVSVAGSAFSPDIRRFIQSSNVRVNLTLRYRYDSGQENLLKRSDQWPFLEAGIPSLFFFTGFHPDYHRSTDTADKINYKKMERVLQLVYLTSWEIADAPSRPKFVHHRLTTPQTDDSLIN
ncbi:MAG: M20/M25/M40 family metallo-hydrolase [Terriglobia bacterium]